MNISKIKINNDIYDISGGSSLTPSNVTEAIYTELYGSTTKPSGAFTVTSLNLSNVLLNAGIGGNVVYSAVGYGISRVNGSGALTIPGTDPIYVVTVTDNISSVTLQNNPTYGHSCHVMFKSADSSSYTIFIGNDNTNRICPTSDGVALTVPATGAGYVEVDFLNTGDSSTGDEVYVRGI